MKHVNKVIAGAFLLSQAFSGAAFAASVTLAGDNFDFTFDDSMLGLFGPATVADDTLYFTPVNFQAESLNGAGYALSNDAVNVQITARSGMTFANIALIEQGGYLLLGSDSTADVSGLLWVRDAAAPLTQVTADIQTEGALDQQGASLNSWTANASTDLSAWTGTQSVNVTVRDILLASTTAGPSVAYVDKAFVGLTVTPVPEAETYAMMLAGLGLVGWRIARRRAAPGGLGKAEASA